VTAHPSPLFENTPLTHSWDELGVGVYVNISVPGLFGKYNPKIMLPAR
jgi:hypothetical protein